MKIKNKLIAFILFFTLSFSFTPAKASPDQCDGLDSVSVANMTWLSAAFLAELTKVILENGYGCDVELIPGDTIPTSVGMSRKQKPDIAPEMWTSSVGEAVKDALNDGILIEASNTFSNNGFEAFWIPSYTAKKYPNLKTVDDLKDHAELFVENASNGLGRIYGCPPGWACEITTTNLFKAYGLGDSFELFSPGSGNNLKTSIARAVKRKKDIVAYYWDPTAVIGQFDLVPLKMHPFDAKKWQCISNPDCINPEKTAFSASPVKVMITENFQKSAPNLALFLSKMNLNNQEVSTVLAWAETNSASAYEAALHYLKTNNAWKNWVSEAVFKKISQSL